MRTRLTTMYAVAAAATIALTLTACSGGSDNGGGQTPSAGDAAGVTTAKERVATYTAVVDGFLPTEAVTDTGSLAGKKAMYIPAVAAVPYFATSFKGAQEAFDTLGISTELCDAQANPSNFASCFDQVSTQGFSAVVVDSIDPSLALQAFNAVAAAGIPIVLVNVIPPEGSPDNVVSFSGPNLLGQQLASNAIIADSNGTAEVVGVKVIDHAGTIGWWDEGVAAEYEELCPECTLTTVETKTTDLQNLPPKVSAALLQSADATYLQAELSPETVPTLQGATDAGRTDLSAAVSAATLADLQQLQNDAALKWAVGWDNVRMQWLAADLVARLLTGGTVDASEYTVEPRVFTAENVADLDVSQSGWDASDWYGGSDYRDQLTQLWGK